MPALRPIARVVLRLTPWACAVLLWLWGAAAVFTLEARAARAPAAEFPPGMELIVAAAPPLVTHPLMVTLDDRGRLFVGDAAGLNLRRKELEEQLPNRVLLLEDQDGDGVFEKRTVFADKMTFPQGAAWLDGSLYVASPPGIWKLTDTTGDGVADQREMIVGGFDFDGNAADVHGPFLHPTNGRLYWCHGRKGHKVVQKDGTLVHEGKASGIWSCRPDGSDVQWHALGSMDNPVEVDFSPEGDLFGVVNLYYNQPRGDTLMHWLYGGVYERPDQLAVIADLPRTQERMPVVHNYGHVAVSGCTFYRSGSLDPSWRGDMLVTYFNTQKVVRTKLIPAGATFRATQHELLKINDPDVHLTDVMEDADGSLLVVDTGGWFRIGCPASLTEKPDLRGAIYRLRKQGQPPVVDAYGQKIDWKNLSSGALAQLSTDKRWKVRERAAALRRVQQPVVGPTAAVLLDAANPPAQLRACEAIARSKQIEPAQRRALLQLLGTPLDPALEHAAMFAAITTRAFDLAALREAKEPTLIRRLMVILEQATPDDSVRDALLTLANRQVDAADADLARAAVALVGRQPNAVEKLQPEFSAKLSGERISAGSLRMITEVTGNHLAKPAAQDVVTLMLRHAVPAVQQAAWRIVGRQPGAVKNADWISPMKESLTAAITHNAGAAPAGSAGVAGVALEPALPLLLEAIAKLGSDQFDAALQALVAETTRPQPIRLKALAARARFADAMDAESFRFLRSILTDATSPTAGVEAARLLARARLSGEQLQALAPLLATTGPIELLELLKLARKLDPTTGRIWAESLVRSPMFGAIEESAIKTAFSSVPAVIYEQTLAPAVRAAAAANDAKKRRLETLTTSAGNGRADEGRKVFATTTCVACHVAGDLGRALGPDLSRIGQIRSARDLLESIIFPSATIARDFETHQVETVDGQTHLGMITKDSPDGLGLMDLTGQEKTIPHSHVVAKSVMTTSLMPNGLEQTLTEQQLLDLVAWLVSLR